MLSTATADTQNCDITYCLWFIILLLSLCETWKKPAPHSHKKGPSHTLRADIQMVSMIPFCIHFIPQSSFHSLPPTSHGRLCTFMLMKQVYFHSVGLFLNVYVTKMFCFFHAVLWACLFVRTYWALMTHAWFIKWKMQSLYGIVSYEDKTKVSCR